MNALNYRFSLDLQSTQSQISIPVLLGDTNRRLYISLTNGGEPYHIADGCMAELVARKADDTSLFNHCIIEKNTNIRYDFTANTASYPGIVNCEVRLYDAEGRLITSPRFIMVVDSRVMYDDDIISESEHTTIDNMILTEAARAKAEEDRVTEFAKSIEASNTATQNCTEATTKATNIANTLETKLASGELNGYTPVKGKDYWTPEDIAQIKSYVSEAILKGEW